MNKSELLKDTRKRLGLTQSEFGDKIGFTQKSISQMETGKAPITDRTVNLIQLIRKLELKIEESDV